MAGESVLAGAVGAGGPNLPPDVGLVQVLLNTMRGMQRKTLLSIDGNCGPLTIAAIREFQTEFAPATDGRVDPRGATLHLLIYSYITIIRVGVYRLGRFPPSLARQSFQERPLTSELGTVLHNALNDIKRGISPRLKPAPRPAPNQPKPTRPEPPVKVEQNV